MTIRVEDKEFKAHRSILRVRTPVFYGMFENQMYDITGVVDILDYDAIAFCEFLRYSYSGRVANCSPNTMCSLHQIADKYEVDDLKEYCLEYIKSNLCVGIFYDALVLAMQHDDAEFMDIAMKFLSENTAEIKNTKKWQIFEYQNPSESDEITQEALKFQKLRYVGFKKLSRKHFREIKR